MGKIEDINKPGYKPKFVSEFSMGSHDFERYNDWLKYVEHWSAEINSTEAPTLEMVQHLFAGLVNLYDSWRPIIAIPIIVERLDEKVNEAKKKKRVWERLSKTNIPINPNLILQLVDILGEIKTKLMDIKQKIGLGIVVKKNLTTKQKIKAGINKISKSDNLPEA